MKKLRTHERSRELQSPRTTWHDWLVLGWLAVVVLLVPLGAVIILLVLLH